MLRDCIFVSFQVFVVLFKISLVFLEFFVTNFIIFLGFRNKVLYNPTSLSRNRCKQVKIV